MMQILIGYLAFFCVAYPTILLNNRLIFKSIFFSLKTMVKICVLPVLNYNLWKIMSLAIQNTKGKCFNFKLQKCKCTLRCSTLRVSFIDNGQYIFFCNVQTKYLLDTVFCSFSQNINKIRYL